MAEHNKLYVIELVDIGDHVDLPYKKIGITGSGNATLDTRLQQLSNTKTPVKARYVAAWEIENARGVEQALHQLLSDRCVEGEWFLDEDDQMVEQLEPLMTLFNATPIDIREYQEGGSEGIMEEHQRNRKARKLKVSNELLGEIAALIEVPLRSSARQSGPTFFGDATDITYYVNIRKTGKHPMVLNKLKDRTREAELFINDELGIPTNHVSHSMSKEMELLRCTPLTPEGIARLITAIERKFDNGE